MTLTTKLPYLSLALTLAACGGDGFHGHHGDEPDGGVEPTGGKTGSGGANTAGGTASGGASAGGVTYGYGGSYAGNAGAGNAGAAGDAGGASDDGGGGAVLSAPSRGAPVALSGDEKIAVAVNRDSGTVSVLSVKYEDGKVTTTSSIGEVDVGKGSEPWQVAIAPDNDTAYVVLRRDQKMVRIAHLSSYPAVEGYVYVGSEPTSVALSPSGRTAYVANWADGSVDVIDTDSMKLSEAVDLNAPLVATGYLGNVKPRAALAHPRSITVTNDGDADDSDETLYVTEYFSQQVEELAADGSNADTNRAGVVYRMDTRGYKVTTTRLSALTDIGFNDANGIAAGCFPNQLQSITLNGNFAYVLSVCAAPEGPEGLKVTAKTCTTVDDCKGADLKLVDPVCDVVAAGKPKVCQDVANFRTATSTVVSVIDTRTGAEVVGAAKNLNAAFEAFFEKTGVADGAKRFPLFGKDLAFVPGTGAAYIAGNGIDTVFRAVYDTSTGKLTEVGSSTQPFIALSPAGLAAPFAGKGPIGIAIGAANKKFALVSNDITRNLTAVDFNTQSVAGGVKTPSVTQLSALPAKGSDEEHILAGKDLFNTGRARWSLNGEGWGACQSCHADGLSDNVTWFFGRGPRQSVSLETSFSSKNPADQRLFNHTTSRDEVTDFEINTRNTSGGVGAIVSAKSVPPINLDRIDTVGLKIAELDGSSLQASDPKNPLGLALDATGKVVVGQLTINPMSPPAGGQLEDWQNITRYIQTIRSPRAPSNLDPAQVTAGAQVFAKLGSCQGCHGGDKWTVSKLFYTPSVKTNAALKVTSFDVPTGFPAAILPARDAQDRKLVINAGGESVQCAQRNVGTFNLAEDGVGISEVRGNNMTDLAQGGGVALRPNADGDNDPTNDPRAGIGYNVPSLLGMSTGAPFMHAGNARTLEALLSTAFAQHYQSLAPNFLIENNPKIVSDEVDQLVQYLLSIDEDTTPISLPTPGAQGGALCPETFSAP